MRFGPRSNAPRSQAAACFAPDPIGPEEPSPGKEPACGEPRPLLVRANIMRQRHHRLCRMHRGLDMVRHSFDCFWREELAQMDRRSTALYLCPQFPLIALIG